MQDNDLPQTYKIVFFGALHPNEAKEVVMKRFGVLFHIQKQTTLEHLFSGNMVVLKSGISREEASQYQHAIEQAGADCSVEPDTSLGKFSGTDANYKRKKKRALSGLSSKGLDNINLEPIETS